MRKRILSTLLASLLVGSLFASFPVNENASENKEQSTVNQETSKETTKNHVTVKELKELKKQLKNPEKISKADAKSKAENSNAFGQEDWILIALWFLLGGLAAHRWYAGKPVFANILFIITAGGCGIWAIIDLIKILQQKFM